MGYYTRISLFAIIAMGTADFVESTKRSLRQPSRSIVSKLKAGTIVGSQNPRDTFLALKPEWRDVNSDSNIYETYRSHLESQSRHKIQTRTKRRLPTTEIHDNVFARKGYKSKKSSGKGKGSRKKTSKSSSKSTEAPSPTQDPSPRPTPTPTVTAPTLSPTSSPTPPLTVEPTCHPHTPEPTRTTKSKSSKKDGKRSKKSPSQPPPPPSPTPTANPPSPTLPIPTAPTVNPPSPIAPTVNPPSPTPPTPTVPTPTLPPTAIEQPTAGPAPTAMPVPTAPVPTRPPIDGPVVAASPFCAEYIGASGVGSEADAVAAAQETCLHIAEYIVASFELNIQQDVTGVNCDQTGSASGEPPRICYDLEVTLDPGLTNTPSQTDLDILIAVSLQDPTVQDLYDRLAALPTSNPFSGTTSVTQSDGPLSLNIVALVGENPTLSSSLVLLGVFAAILFHRCYGHSRIPEKNTYRSHEIRSDPWSVLDRDCHVLFSIDENGEEETFSRLAPFKD